MPQFILKIDLGNDGMQGNKDVSLALHQAAESVISCGIGCYAPHNIRDINGNVVGHYEVVN